MNEIVALEGEAIKSNRVFVEWHLSPFCNRNCSYCTELTHTNEPIYLSLDKFKMGFDNLTDKVELDKLSIGFTGGEPTLHKADFIRMLEYSQDARRLTLVTN